jgi:phosphoenolpyruvate carboxykinase (ATP)
MSPFSLKEHGITVREVDRNLPPPWLYEEAVRHEPDSRIASTGALVAYSGEKTGRSPKEKRVVRRAPSEAEVWWGPVNIPIDPAAYEAVRARARGYLNTCPRVYCVDGFAGWDPEYRVKVRVICARPYHALFMRNMLVRPTRDELAGFGAPDYVIYNAGPFPADPDAAGMTSATSVALSLEDRELVILGTEYAGEMKKGLFTVMNYLLPKRGVLPMHCSATADRATGRSSLLFGLSGTGKTTLSADPKRLLVGDDEHAWTDRGVFNIEGGCYAKTIGLTAANEPDIFQALRFGALLENVVLDESDRRPDFDDASLTENTRGSYPVEFLPNAKIPCVAGQPTDVIFLSCDAFGVLPPVSRLTPEQALYHFLSGYTARVAGTEVGVTEPRATFSPCFGGPFLAWHPSRYAAMLAAKLARHQARAWLVNTGWTGGPYGTGSRIKLAYTRAIVDAIHDGSLAAAPTAPDTEFGLGVVTACPGVPPEILLPRHTWPDPAAYDEAARRLAGLFRENFRAYETFGPTV